jgi:hypothetical protein
VDLRVSNTRMRIHPIQFVLVIGVALLTCSCAGSSGASPGTSAPTGNQLVLHNDTSRTVRIIEATAIQGESGIAAQQMLNGHCASGTPGCPTVYQRATITPGADATFNLVPYAAGATGSSLRALYLGSIVSRTCALLPPATSLDRNILETVSQLPHGGPC